MKDYVLKPREGTRAEIDPADVFRIGPQRSEAEFSFDQVRELAYRAGHTYFLFQKNLYTTTSHEMSPERVEQYVFRERWHY